MIQQLQVHSVLDEGESPHSTSDNLAKLNSYRICAGRFMALNSVFIAIASILQVFELSNPRDESGKEIPVEYDFTSGLFSSVPMIVLY